MTTGYKRRLAEERATWTIHQNEVVKNTNAAAVNTQAIGDTLDAQAADVSRIEALLREAAERDQTTDLTVLEQTLKVIASNTKLTAKRMFWVQLAAFLACVPFLVACALIAMGLLSVAM